MTPSREAYTGFYMGLTMIFISSFITLTILELTYRMYKRCCAPESYDQRTILYSAGSNFMNMGGFFKYEPNKTIQVMTVFWRFPYDPSDLKIEYGYEFQTNNAGLVMQADIVKGEDAFFLVGDSFTEGLGAPPWFYELESEVREGRTPFLNLGISNTGPGHWLNSVTYFESEFELNTTGVVVNMIPADMNRHVRVFSETEISCLESAVCDYLGGIMGFDFKKSPTESKAQMSLLYKHEAQSTHANTNKDKPSSCQLCIFSYVISLPCSKTCIIFGALTLG